MMRFTPIIAVFLGMSLLGRPCFADKFIVLYSLRSLDPTITSGTFSKFEFPTRSDCEIVTSLAEAQIIKETSGRVEITQHACIQIDGPVKKLPVIEEIAEGWERV